MIRFEYKINERATIAVDDVSILFNKHHWSQFQEAVTQHLKQTLIHDLASLRDEIEESNCLIRYVYDSSTSSYRWEFEDISDALSTKVKNATA